MAITKEQIFQVADELDAKGQNPTLTAVRKQLGGGSYSTISEAMTKWKANKAAKENPLREPAPQAVTELLSDLGSEIWSRALELANGRLETERENLGTARVELEAGKAEAIELADHLATELEGMQSCVAELKETETAARKEIDGLREQIAGLTVRAATAEARAAEIEKRANDLNSELERMNKQNSELVKALAGSAAAGKKRPTKALESGSDRPRQ